MRKMAVTAAFAASALALTGCSAFTSVTGGSDGPEYCAQADELWAALDNFDKDISGDYALDAWVARIKKEIPNIPLGIVDEDLRFFDGDREMIVNLIGHHYELLSKLQAVGEALPEDEAKTYYEPAKDALAGIVDGMAFVDDMLKNEPPADPSSLEPPKSLEKLQNSNEAENGVAVQKFFHFVANSCPRPGQTLKDAVPDLDCKVVNRYVEASKLDPENLPDPQAGAWEYQQAVSAQAQDQIAAAMALLNDIEKTDYAPNLQSLVADVQDLQAEYGLQFERFQVESPQQIKDLAVKFLGDNRPVLVLKDLWALTADAVAACPAEETK